MENRIKELEEKLDKTKSIAQKSFHEVEQTLGKALGYPWYKDDSANFPDATEADGVCTGEHVPESISSEAANKIKELESELAEAKDALKAMFAACDEWAAEFTQKKRAMDWGVVNAAYTKAAKIIRPAGSGRR
jgi:hypothetical protein